jgi:hypothetical protein
MLATTREAAPRNTVADSDEGARDEGVAADTVEGAEDEEEEEEAGEEEAGEGEEEGADDAAPLLFVAAAGVAGSCAAAGMGA